MPVLSVSSLLFTNYPHGAGYVGCFSVVFVFILFERTHEKKKSKPFRITWSGFLSMSGIMHDAKLQTTA